MISFTSDSNDGDVKSDSFINVSQLLNLVVLVYSIIIFKTSIKYINKKLIIGFFIFFLFLLLNYIITDYASLKWFINWLGFGFVSLTIIQSIQSVTTEKFIELENILRIWYTKCFILLGSVFFVVFLLNFSELVEYLYAFKLDYVIEILTRNIGLYKQLWGPFVAFTFLFNVFIWKKNKVFEKAAYYFFFIVAFPAILSVRTLWLGLILITIWLYVAKKLHRKIITFIILFTFGFYLYINWNLIEPILYIAYDRLPSLKFAFGYTFEHIFGLGNGGYHTYVGTNNDKVVSDYGSDRMLMSGNFWIAPESDLVYFVASWGILSFFFFYLFYLIINKSANIFHSQNIKTTTIEKFLLIMASTIIFMGISEDFAGKLDWFIFLSFGLGIILKLSHEKV